MRIKINHYNVYEISDDILNEYKQSSNYKDIYIYDFIEWLGSHYYLDDFKIRSNEEVLTCNECFKNYLKGL